MMTFKKSLSIGQGKIANLTFGRGYLEASLFTPLSLFANGEQGAWYDPSDISTLFQDAAGTTPVTASGQPVGLILDKSQKLSYGPDLVTNGEFTTNTNNWSAFNAVLSVENGTIKVDDSVSAGDNSSAQQQLTGLVVGKSYMISGQIISSSGSGNIVLWQEGDNTTITSGASFQLVASVAQFNGSGIFTASGTAATIGLVSNGNSITYFDNLSVRELNGNHATQSVAANRPTYRAGGGLAWLEFDGVNDTLEANPIGSIIQSISGFYVATHNNSQKTEIVFGAQGDSTANRIQFYANTDGKRYVGIQGNNGSSFSQSGTATTKQVAGAVWNGSNINSYINAVESFNSNQSGNLDLTTGIIYVGGSPNFSSLRFAGVFYGGILVASALSDDEISQTTQYLANKSGVTL